MKASADASIIIDLPKDESLILLAKKRYSKIYVPTEVFDEHRRPKKHVQRISLLIEEGFIEKEELNRTGMKYLSSLLSRGKMGKGECAAIALALQLDLPEILLDDKLAISTASKLGLRCVPICYLPLWGLLKSLRDYNSPRSPIWDIKKSIVTSEGAEKVLKKLFSRDDPNLLVLLGILHELERYTNP